MKFIIPLLPFLLLASCATKATRPSPAPVEVNDLADGIIKNELADYSVTYPSDISAIKVPILKASGYGNPKYSVMDDGSYLATYRQGKKYLHILGTQRPPVTFSYPPIGTIRLLNQTVGYYGTGNEDPEYTSKVTSFTAPDGRTANYAIVYGVIGTSLRAEELEKVKFGW